MSDELRETVNRLVRESLRKLRGLPARPLFGDGEAAVIVRKPATMTPSNPKVQNPYEIQKR